ncbi:tRNA (adenosine(37)-N6)-threonylcarbamoyltransferase complex ATPase subunit type 1 TsaE [Laceyella putida]|uniref:tRNA threonylcarbamoyladenosine biosynthesis protein TsaE n=1 Tax=Laceyella putida TaxID=110101 RepID=A0ABW2RKM0_9BACL
MEKVCVLTTASEQETRAVALKLVTLLGTGDVLALEGDLGAGKTTFAKGIAEGLAIEEEVDSPTFTIIKEYEGTLPLYHMDVYRLDGFEELGLEEYFYGDGICLVEWASRVEAWLPEETLWLRFSVRGDGTREIAFYAGHSRWESICKELGIG